jgi:hypothetical protein
MVVHAGNVSPAVQGMIGTSDDDNDVDASRCRTQTTTQTEQATHQCGASRTHSQSCHVSTKTADVNKSVKVPNPTYLYRSQRNIIIAMDPLIFLVLVEYTQFWFECAPTSVIGADTGGLGIGENGAAALPSQLLNISSRQQ